jgi:hypothetical protein
MLPQRKEGTMKQTMGLMAVLALLACDDRISVTAPEASMPASTPEASMARADQAQRDGEAGEAAAATRYAAATGRSQATCSFQVAYIGEAFYVTGNGMDLVVGSIGGTPNPPGVDEVAVFEWNPAVIPYAGFPANLALYYCR